MSVKGRKVFVFIITITIFTSLFVLLIFKSPTTLEAGLGDTFIWAIVGAGMTLVGGNCFDKWTKSKHFKKEIFFGEEIIEKEKEKIDSNS